ncbi:MAG: hypothetical protein ICV67_05600, partial [Thermoleophilia bacterium]|nr:hypothetical protein [Thermoleophilia bacterium]
EPDDGLFDVLLIGDLTKRDLMVTLPKIFRGKHLPHPKAEVLRGARVTVDGGAREGRMHDVVVAVGRYFGGGMMILPEAEPDDGLFDVLLIGDLTKRDLLQTLPKTYRGKHLPHPKAEVLRGAVVTVDADEPLPIELDGEQPGTTPASFEIVPRALRVRVP